MCCRVQMVRTHTRNLGRHYTSTCYNVDAIIEEHEEIECGQIPDMTDEPEGTETGVVSVTVAVQYNQKW